MISANDIEAFFFTGCDRAVIVNVQYTRRLLNYFPADIIFAYFIPQQPFIIKKRTEIKCAIFYFHLSNV